MKLKTIAALLVACAAAFHIACDNQTNDEALYSPPSDIDHTHDSIDTDTDTYDTEVIEEEEEEEDKSFDFNQCTSQQLPIQYNWIFSVVSSPHYNPSPESCAGMGCGSIIDSQIISTTPSNPDWIGASSDIIPIIMEENSGFLISLQINLKNLSRLSFFVNPSIGPHWSNDYDPDCLDGLFLKDQTFCYSNKQIFAVEYTDMVSKVVGPNGFVRTWNPNHTKGFVLGQTQKFPNHPDVALPEFINGKVEFLFYYQSPSKQFTELRWNNQMILKSSQLFLQNAISKIGFQMYAREQMNNLTGEVYDFKISKILNCNP